MPKGIKGALKKARRQVKNEIRKIIGVKKEEKSTGEAVPSAPDEALADFPKEFVAPGGLPEDLAAGLPSVPSPLGGPPAGLPEKIAFTHNGPPGGPPLLTSDTPPSFPRLVSVKSLSREDEKSIER